MSGSDAKQTTLAEAGWRQSRQPQMRRGEPTRLALSGGGSTAQQAILAEQVFEETCDQGFALRRGEPSGSRSPEQRFPLRRKTRTEMEVHPQ